MANVKTYKCFPTSIHEVKLNIETHDRKNMLIYIILYYLITLHKKFYMRHHVFQYGNNTNSVWF